MSSHDLVLASSSPNRADVMTRLGLRFQVRVSGYAEDLDKNSMGPDDYVTNTAKNKGLAVLDDIKREQQASKTQGTRGKRNVIVVAADTIVEINGEIYEKPKDKQEQFENLKKFHENRWPMYVKTAVWCFDLYGNELSHLETTQLLMDHENLSTEFIKAYCDSNEALDAAGGFKIQAKGGLLFKGVLGDYWNVVGLPYTSTYRLIEQIKRCGPRPGPGSEEPL